MTSIQHVISYIPSHANFVTFRLSDAPAGVRQLLNDGVVVRPLAAYKMHDYIRVTVGTEEENAAFLQSMLKVISPENTSG
jgi:histidinol-phosphate aminotransferase